MIPQPGGLPAVLGDFAIAGVLGEGGSGTVYDARWGHRRVALKVLRAELVPTAKERDRFFAEAALLQAVDHPGVVKVLGSGTLPDGRPYLAMEHLDGESLATRIARGPMSVGEAMALFSQLASAVQALHARGLIHRDVKPENVILTGPYAVLLDFGIAKPSSAPASTVTQEGAVRGTPAYMAPERFFGQPAGVATDIYELAVMFFAMVTGQLPWASPIDPAARLNPTSPSSLGCALPGDLETVVLRALSTRAEARPASVAELVHRMSAAVGAASAAPGEARETVSLKPPGPPPRNAITPVALATTSLAHATPPSAHQTGHATGPAPHVTGHVTGPPPHITGTAPRSRHRTLLIAGALLAAAAAGAATLALVSRAGTSTSTSTSTSPGAIADAAPPTGVTTATPADTTPPASPASRWPAEPPALPAAALATMLSLHPPDTMMLIAVSPRRLHESPIVTSALDDNRDAEGLKYLRVLEAACGFDDLLGSLDFVTLGAAEAPSDDIALDLVVRGTFSRDRIEKCLTDIMDEPGAPGTARRRGAITRITGGKDTLWFGWRDASTVLVTSRDIDDAWMKARLASRKPFGGAALMPPLLADVDTGSAAWAIAQPPTAGGSPISDIRPPRAMFASILVKKDIRLHAGLRYDTAGDAAETTRTLQKQFADFTKDPIAGMFMQDAAIGAVGNDAIFTISIGEMMAGITVKSLIELAGK